MESTRNWLAETVDADPAHYARGMAAWLRADGGAAPAGRKQCRRVLASLVAWLRGKTAATAADLTPRQRSLARSFLVEVLKQDGLLESRRRRVDVAALLASFFASESAPVLPLENPEP